MRTRGTGKASGADQSRKTPLSLSAAVAIRGIGITLLLTVAAAAIVWWIAAAHDRQEKLRNNYYWDSYLTTLYGLHGSWPGVTDVLKTDKTSRADIGRVRVWDAERRPVFRADESDVSAGSPPAGRELRPILYRGAIVGYFEAASPLRPFLADWKPFAVLFAAAAAGIGLFLTLSQFAKNGQAYERARFRGRLSRLLNGPADIRGSACEDSPRTDKRTDREAGLLDPDIEHLLDRLDMRIRKLEKVRKTMVADIAHELRTPLAVMRAQLDNALVRQTPLPPESLVLLHDEVYRITKLVHDLQQLALAESGHLALEKRWFSLRELTGSVAEALDLTAEESGCRISVVCPDEARTYGDEARIQQVLVNIIGNAVRHAKSSVHLAVESGERQSVILITDDGTGIEEEELPHVFERFYRGSRKPDATGGAAGLGLGLAIVKEYVEAHRGSVSVSSVWGRGTTFAITLPVFAED
ncbi:sensor histidine kinase [Paenibacillus ginsengarvi]|uniref:histidine kinase n=1 Tax=Paenibacillus ginsengarvi TaxID=400777 RepID=A0A3B0CIG4_9BACL|nr:HAMP domain-containing sensor histidine kinase [Paenibacillus ginsengarvi]RKN84364.1 sensor histidine kinase [Paenibacillus ginsengarvi]